jgi:hypothetical protein
VLNTVVVSNTEEVDLLVPVSAEVSNVEAVANTVLNAVVVLNTVA